jgi:hypothetical protein
MNSVVHNFAVACGKLQKENIDICSTIKIINELELKLLEDVDLNKSFLLFSEIVKAQQLEMSLTDVEKVRNKSKKLIKSAVSRLNDRFKPTFLNTLVEIFHPMNIRNSSAETHNEKSLDDTLERYSNDSLQFKYCSSVDVFGCKFTPQQMFERLQDFKLLKQYVEHNSNLQTANQVWIFCMRSHQFVPAITLVMICQFCILISPTSVDCERGVSAVNDIKDNDSNRMGNYLLNQIVQIKSNGESKPSSNLLLEATKHWLSRVNRRNLYDAKLEAAKINQRNLNTLNLQDEVDDEESKSFSISLIYSNQIFSFKST